jgi:hypothetical protein
MQLNYCYSVTNGKEAHDRRKPDKGASIVGKAEVVSSILTGSTIFPFESNLIFPCRGKAAAYILKNRSRVSTV